MWARERKREREIGGARRESGEEKHPTMVIMSMLPGHAKNKEKKPKEKRHKKGKERGIATGASATSIHSIDTDEEVEADVRGTDDEGTDDGHKRQIQSAIPLETSASFITTASDAENKAAEKQAFEATASTIFQSASSIFGLESRSFYGQRKKGNSHQHLLTTLHMMTTKRS